MMALPIMMAAGYANGVTAEQTVVGGEKVTSTRGLVSWAVDNTDKSQQNQYTSTYAPVSTMNYTIPIITITGSDVRDTGNTGYEQPVSLSPTASQERTSESGLDLTSIIVPVAGIAGVAALGYALLGGKK